MLAGWQMGWGFPENGGFQSGDLHRRSDASMVDNAAQILRNFPPETQFFLKSHTEGTHFFVHPETGIRASIPVPGGISLLSILSVPRPNPGKFAGLSHSGRSLFPPFLCLDIGEIPHLFP